MIPFPPSPSTSSCVHGITTLESGSRYETVTGLQSWDHWFMIFSLLSIRNVLKIPEEFWLGSGENKTYPSDTDDFKNDILKSIQGLDVFQSGQKGQQTSIFTRGSESNHTLVLLNGIPINDQSSTDGLHDFGQDFIQTIQQLSNSYQNAWNTGPGNYDND